MDSISAVALHFAHPFSSTVDKHKVTLSPLEKQIATIVALASLILVVITPIAVVAAPVLFYGLTAFFKCKNLNKSSTLADVQKAEDIAFTYIPVKPQTQNHYKVKAQTKVPAKSQTEKMHNIDAQTNASANEPIPALPLPPPFPNPPRKLNERFQFNETINKTSMNANSSADSSNSAVTLRPAPQQTLTLGENIYEIMMSDAMDSRDKKSVISMLFHEINDLNQIMGKLEPIFESFDLENKFNFMQSLPDYLQDRFFMHFLNRVFNYNKVPGDGNCCLYALTRGLHTIPFISGTSRSNFMEKCQSKYGALNEYNEKQYAQELRGAIIEHMRHHPETYAPYFTEGGNYQTYLDGMSEDRKWLGLGEINAFAVLFEVPVIIYDPNLVTFRGQQLCPSIDCLCGREFLGTTTNRISLYHKNGNHYDLLNPKTGTIPLLPETA